MVKIFPPSVPGTTSPNPNDMYKNISNGSSYESMIDIQGNRIIVSCENMIGTKSYVGEENNAGIS